MVPISWRINTLQAAKQEEWEERNKLGMIVFTGNFTIAGPSHGLQVTSSGHWKKMKCSS